MRVNERQLLITIMSQAHGWSDKQIADLIGDDITAVRQDIKAAASQFQSALTPELTPRQKEARILRGAMTVGRVRLITGTLNAMEAINNAEADVPQETPDGRLMSPTDIDTFVSHTLIRASAQLKAMKDGAAVLGLLDRMVGDGEVHVDGVEDAAKRNQDVATRLINRFNREAERYLDGKERAEKKRYADPTVPTLEDLRKTVEADDFDLEELTQDAGPRLN